MSATEVFIKGLQAATGNDLFPEKFWRSYPEKSTYTFQDALGKYDEYYQTLNLEQQKAMSEIFWNQIKTLGSSIIEDHSNEEVKATQALIQKILDNANIPALSVSWAQKNTNKELAVGITDTSNPKPVDTTTLFQASSLSKPVSAAIALDLMAQKKWKLNTLLADISDYGPPELKADSRYRELTIGMVIGQCSGLPNLAASESEKKFIATTTPGTDYSGLALDFLKEAIEKKTGKKWETIAQEFFSKVGMQNSTFKQLQASHLQGKSDVARGHQADGTPDPVAAPIDSPEIPAASLLTTANDFMIFLQYCFRDDFLRSTLLTGVYKLNKEFPKTPLAANQIQWGLGMGIYTDEGKTIAFHWGNNPGWNSFCAINTKTGDAVASFANSDNGSNVFQQLAEPVIGELTLLFDWLSNYCNFKAQKTPKTPNSITALFPLVNALTEKGTLPSVVSQSIFSQPQRQDKKIAKDDIAFQRTKEKKAAQEFSSETEKKRVTSTDDFDITYGKRPGK